MWIVSNEDKVVASTWGATVRLTANEPKQVGDELGLLCLQAGCTEVKGGVPDIKVDCITSAGNSAGSGARIALLNYEMRKEIEAQVKEIEKVETAIEPKFQDFFVAARAEARAAARVVAARAAARVAARAAATVVATAEGWAI